VIAGFPDPDAATEVAADDTDDDTADDSELGDLVIVELPAESAIRSARYGLVEPSPDPALVARIAASVQPHLGGPSAQSPSDDVLVLGSEEFIGLPLLVADDLDRRAVAGTGTGRVLFSTTTRSPIAPLDRPDYAIASRIRFRSSDLTVDGFGDRFAYNLTRGGRRFATIVLMPEPGSDVGLLLAPDGVVQALRRVTDRVVVALLPAVLPNPDEWMLQP
jgi:hypothetical protein